MVPEDFGVFAYSWFGRSDASIVNRRTTVKMKYACYLGFLVARISVIVALKSDDFYSGFCCGISEFFKGKNLWERF